MSTLVSLSPITVEELDRGAFRALAPAWEALAARSPAAGPFLLPEWFAVYAADLAADAPDGAGPSLRILAAHRHGELAAVLPLLVEKRRIGGVPVRVLRSLSDDHSQRFELLSDGEDATRAILEHLARDGAWDVLELRDLPSEGSSAGQRLADLAAAAGWPTGTWPAMSSPYLPLPRSVEALDASLPAKFRSNLRRRAKRLAEEVGPLRLERVTDPAAIDQALDEGFALEASGWKARQGTAIAQDGRLRRRYGELARVLHARGELALYFLVAGRQRVAFHFAAESKGTYFLFKPGYDETLAKYGLGHLLLLEVARELVGRGAQEIDFLGDDMEWKRCWTETMRHHSWRYVFRPTPFGRALCAWKFQAIPLLRRGLDELRARMKPAANDNATHPAPVEDAA